MLRRRTYSKEVDSGKYQVCYADSGFLVSSDYGRTWKEAGKYSYCMGEDYDLAMSADGRYRFCSANAAVTSSDYGNTWQEGSTLGTAKGGVYEFGRQIHGDFRRCCPLYEFGLWKDVG